MERGKEGRASEKLSKEESCFVSISDRLDHLLWPIVPALELLK